MEKDIHVCFQNYKIYEYNFNVNPGTWWYKSFPIVIQ